MGHGGDSGTERGEGEVGEDVRVCVLNEISPLPAGLQRGPQQVRRDGGRHQKAAALAQPSPAGPRPQVFPGQDRGTRVQPTHGDNIRPNLGQIAPATTPGQWALDKTVNLSVTQFPYLKMGKRIPR